MQEGQNNERIIIFKRKEKIINSEIHKQKTLGLYLTKCFKNAYA